MKFIIVSMGRTGSTLLKSLLDSHPNIKAFGEELGAVFSLMTTMKDQRAVLFHVFSYPSQCVGMKIMYHHINDVVKKYLME